MAYNQLEGELPLALGFSFPKIRFFSIIVNQFTGSIPTSFSNASSLEELQLGGNYFTGRVPSLDKLHRLLRFNIAENHLGNGKANDLEFFSTITNATNLVTLAIDVNNFGGKLPEQFCNFSKKLQNMYIAYNQIFGNIPNRVSDCAALEVLMATENKLSGIIPSSIEKLQNLRLLFLDNNDFFGSIPSSIGNMTNLIRTDLSNNILEGNIPWTLGNCKNLLELKLSYNNLSGPIPPQIFKLSSLSLALDLSRNHLSGTILSEVGNLKNIDHLSLSENLLSGVIPSGLSSCTSLQFLYLGANFFQDTIPSSLSSLRGLQELNLSHNMLSGKIPEFLKDFHFLELVDVSYNNFEDKVPIEGVFKNATATSIVGNENLCGGIPDFRLPPCKLEKSKKGLTVKLKIVISMVSVLISVGLVLVCLFLYHSRKKKGESKSRSFGNSLLKLSYQSLLKATNEFSSDNLIGTGSFGSVYKGILDQEGIVIAVKVLNLMRQGASKSFITECEALRNIKHRNLVKVLTACSGVDYRGNDFKALIYEFMVNGSLEDWLHPTPRLDEMKRTLNILQRLNIVIDVACALEYLHHHSGTPIVHCDLKPSNVLLDEEMTGHVSDFGLAKFLSNEMLEYSASQSNSIGIRGTIGYCAPEYGMGSKISTFGDIFSFGILLLEIFTGNRPTDDIFKEGLNLHNFVKRALPEEVADITDPYLLQTQLNTDATSNHTHNFRNMMRNSKTIECLISIFKIGISCSVESRQERMSIGDAAVQLSSIKNNLLELDCFGR